MAAQARPGPLPVQPARSGKGEEGRGEGKRFAAHLFLCLAGPRALFAQQHVVPQEEIKPALKVQGTAKLCWEVAGPGLGWSNGAGGLRTPSVRVRRRGTPVQSFSGERGLTAGLFWQRTHTRGLSVTSHPLCHAKWDGSLLFLELIKTLFSSDTRKTLPCSCVFPSRARMGERKENP